MKLSTLLVLCCSFFFSRANPLPTEDADCDDPDVFEATDIALKRYNEDKRDGNQFALYMVMEAKRTTGPSKHFFLKYQIRETSCAVGEEKLWQDCDYSTSAKAESGECTAQVYIDKAEKISNVTQECKITPGKVTLSQAACLGCFQPIPGDSLQLLPIVRYTIRIFNNQSEQSALFEVGEIIKASRQVVAGWNYALEYEVKETNCSKKIFHDLSPACKPISGGHVGRCQAKVYVDLSNTIVDVGQNCKFPVEETAPPRISTCPGCPRPIPTNSAELEEPLRATLEKFNAEYGDDFFYKAEEILNATVQVVAGKKYNITFTIRKTNCSKRDVKKLGEDCVTTKDGETLKCTAQVWMVPWIQSIRPEVNCREQKTILARRPPGLTPFRTAIFVGNAQNTTHTKNEEGPKDGQSPGTGAGKHIRCKPGHEQGHRHDPACGPEHKHKHEHEGENGHRHDPEHDPECGPEHERGHGREGKHGHRHDPECGPEHEHGHGREGKHGCGPEHGYGKHKDKQKNIKNKHSKDEPSEELHDQVAVPETPETSLPREPDQVKTDVLPSPRHPTGDLTDGLTEISEFPAETQSPGIIPDVPLFGGLPDLPEPSAPKCPGKPWKPVIDTSTTTKEPQPLKVEDLLPHPSEDTNPVTEKHAHTPQDSKDFDLEDLLQ
ncbi:kininogen-1 [Carettochelys insculpta]|uniref:kininogen-1 n=1 Tax=Carettochelys insculpta TaxID=44489 RepID=UPI003EBE505B